METSNLDQCRAGQCGFLTDPDQEITICALGNNDCINATLLPATPSKFHDQALIDATHQINQIIAALPIDPEGRRPSLLITKLGAMLAWVYHDGRAVGDNYVTSEDDDATVIAALKLQV